jgi:fucose permease
VDRIAIDTLVRLSTFAALGGTALFAWNPVPGAAPVALAISGLGLAIIFPCLMSRTPQRIGAEAAAHAIGFQVGAAMLGAAALPSLNGFLAQRAGLPTIGFSLALTAAALLVLHEILLIRSRHQGIAPPAPHGNAVT